MASVLRRSHLNRALVAKAKNTAKAEHLGLMYVCFWLGFRISFSSYLGLYNCALVSLFQKSIYMSKVSSVTLFV